MMIHDDEKKITVSAVYRLLIGAFITSTAFAIFFNIYPTAHIIDSIIPSIDAIVLLTVLIYYHYNPHSDINKVIIFYILFFIITFSPATIYYVWMAWNNEWRFVDEYPPVSGLIMAVIMLGIIMLPKQYKRYIVLMWASISLPIITYLLSHPDELQTPRGYELIGTFGPASLLLYVVFPYQKSINRHMNKVTGDLRRYELEAGRDYLTDIYNRRGLSLWLGQLKHDDNIGVLLIDVDHFKQINDRHGHSIGDRILVELASRLRTIYFEKHTIARWGGEEFAVILVNPKTNTLPFIGSMFQHTLSALPYKAVGKVTISVGISTIAHHEDFCKLIEQADKALYSAKNNGRDQSVMYNDSLTEHHSQAS
ncbi:GGDEF domain-containing protein [Marinomonas rhizomae]|uniref:GGDEF domain-containing protein n=1 Tax=Marinomonas rhizomae TaxID=491948 RepID=UPI00210624CA|nr:GGDEF domain-containing protein [Marinomonas rhizomae]UTV99784.1 GGDEF domain-containing protein [Marinomonas rhizomae]